MAELRGTGGSILRSSFDETKDEALRAALASAQAAQSAQSAQSAPKVA
jgi:uncharacterized membrane protein